MKGQNITIETKLRCEWVTEERKSQKCYGQTIMAVCDCGILTNWHTDRERAVKALEQNHNDEYMQLN